MGLLALEDILDNLPRYNESVLSVDMDQELQEAYEQLEEEMRAAMREHRGNKSLMSILLNTLLLIPIIPTTSTRSGRGPSIRRPKST